MNENQLQALLEAVRTLQDLGKVAYFNKGAYNSETTYEINDVVSYNGSSYVSLVNENRGNLPTNIAFWSVVASKGEKGDTGKAFVIEKTYSTIEDMVDDYDNMEINDYVMIQGSIEEQENATLWTKREVESSPYRWTYLADFSGASGITGATPNIQIGTVTEGNQPSVVRRAGSTNENPIFDFVLKTGAKGETGDTGNGISSVSKTGTSGLTDIYTIVYTNGGSDTFNVVNGKGIVSIQKTGSVDTVDTYTITYNDGTTSTFEVTNGEVTQAQLDETNEEVERAKMVYNALPKVSDEGTELTLNNTAECPMYEVGLRPSELSQDEEPTPENPQDIHVVSGDNEVKIENKNLAKETFDQKIITTGSGQTRPVVVANAYSGEIIKVKPNTSYTCSGDFTNLTSGAMRIAMFDEYPVIGSVSTKFIFNTNTFAFTTDTNTKYILLENGTDTNTTVQNLFICETQYATTYEPHKEQTYPLSLGDLEYCKIGDYEDVFFKNVVGSTYYDSTLELNKWYLKKNFIKYIFDGTENWGYNTSATTPTNRTVISAGFTRPLVNNYISNRFVYQSQTSNKLIIQTNGTIYISIADTLTGIETTDSDSAKLQKMTTYLSNNNVVVYYPINISTYTLLNNTLQTQLDNIQKAISYQEQTNVSQENNDLPFVIKMSAIRDFSGIFDLITG